MKNIQYMVPILALIVVAIVASFALTASEKEGSVNETETTRNIIDDRKWAVTPEQIQSHDRFVAYVEHDFPDTYRNKVLIAEQIKSYNLETEIGTDVDGYELSGLVAKLEKIECTYLPTVSEKRMHDWAFLTYDIPDNEKEIRDRLSEITNNADMDLVLDLHDSINAMTDIGAVSQDLFKMDSNYWVMVKVRTACEHHPDCDLSMISGFNNLSYTKVIPVPCKDGIEDTASSAVSADIPSNKDLAVAIDPNHAEFWASVKGALNDREWAVTPEQIESHNIFKSYVENDVPDNYLNRVLVAEQIKSYNLETEIGTDVDGYELSGLVAKLEIINGTYSPTEPEKRMHDWAFLTYDIPDDETEIMDRLSEMTLNADFGMILESYDSINAMTDIGAVSIDIFDTDQEYWIQVSVKISCEHNPECDLSMIRGFDDPLALETIPATSYKPSWGYINVSFPTCKGTVSNCMGDDIHTGSGIMTLSFISHEHVDDLYVPLEMYASGPAGTTVVVTGQIIEPLAGNSLAKSHAGDYAIKYGQVSNPSARDTSHIEAIFTSYAYSDDEHMAP